MYRQFRLALTRDEHVVAVPMLAPAGHVFPLNLAAPGAPDAAALIQPLAELLNEEHGLTLLELYPRLLGPAFMTAMTPDRRRVMHEVMMALYSDRCSGVRADRRRFLRPCSMDAAGEPLLFLVALVEPAGDSGGPASTGPRARRHHDWREPLHDVSARHAPAIARALHRPGGLLPRLLAPRSLEDALPAAVAALARRVSGDRSLSIDWERLDGGRCRMHLGGRSGRATINLNARAMCGSERHRLLRAAVQACQGERVD